MPAGDAAVDSRSRRARVIRRAGAGLLAAAVAAGIGVPLLTRTSAGQPHVTTTGGSHPAPVPTSTPAPPTTASVGSTTTSAPPVANTACGELQPQSAPAGATQAATATWGSFTARLTGAGAGPYADGSLSSPTLSVQRDGATVYSQPVRPPTSDMPGPSKVIPMSIVATGAFPAQNPPPSQPMCLARFAGQDHPVVVLGLNLGGAHCCTIVRVVDPLTGVQTEADLRNPPATMVDRPAGALVVTGDDAFNYRFASYAGSGTPVKVLELRSGRLVDTTVEHLDLVAADAERWIKAFEDAPGNGLGLLAAWVADECRLGRSASAWAAVDRYNAEGSLTGPTGWPTGSAYVSALRSFVSQRGYC
ncbi:MAG TPA: hypothetical protein VFA11_14340 [Acidimicrobiales bacterium]|nr:hypothetical protein [Acidimicrobiales bacterium]